jgi:hypothetical protein
MIVGLHAVGVIGVALATEPARQNFLARSSRRRSHVPFFANTAGRRGYLVRTAGDAAVCRGDGTLGTDAAQVVAVHDHPFATRIVRIVETTHDGQRESAEHRTQKPGSTS